MSNKVNVVGDFKKSGLTKKQLKKVVETVFDVLDSPLSSSGLTRGYIKKMDFRRSLSAGEIPASAGMTKEAAGMTHAHKLCTGQAEEGGNDKIINIAFVGSKKIRELNKKYRKIDKSTDVLSFDYGDEGDILLCVDIIDKHRGSDSLRNSVVKTLIHGALHLYGYNHENDKNHAIMEVVENKIYSRIHLD